MAWRSTYIFWEVPISFPLILFDYYGLSDAVLGVCARQVLIHSVCFSYQQADSLSIRN